MPQDLAGIRAVVARPPPRPTTSTRWLNMRSRSTRHGRPTRRRGGRQPAAESLAQKGSAIAQNRLARVLATGRGAPGDEVEALKWHLIAKEAGNGDPTLDSMLASLDPADRKKSRGSRSALVQRQSQGS